MAWQLVKADECRGCGQPRSESMVDGSAWLVQRHVCRACAAVAATAKDDKAPGAQYATTANTYEIGPDGW